MFPTSIYQKRRKLLLQTRSDVEKTIVFLGHFIQGKNYPANPYTPFRQSSHLLYYTGIREPQFSLLIHQGESILVGQDPTLEDVVWEGNRPSLFERAEQCGISKTMNLSELPAFLVKNQSSLALLQPFQADVCQFLDRVLGYGAWQSLCCQRLSETVIEQRLVKSIEEIEEIEEGIASTAEVFEYIAEHIQAGKKEADFAGFAAQKAYSRGVDFSYSPIITVQGEVLHQHSTSNTLQKGQMLLVDLGLDSPKGYASDITRTFAVSESFTDLQQEVYQAVLKAQEDAIQSIRPNISFKEVHQVACCSMASSLVAMGWLKGNPEEIVAKGAHALFFPHGLGHALGLDVHDMEDLGDWVGYKNEQRSAQFGTHFLRFARNLQEGYVVTVEPGIYLIPSLIQQWKTEKRFEEHIAYHRFDSLRDFGGIRIEDDVLVTTKGSQILGKPIAK